MIASRRIYLTSSLAMVALLVLLLGSKSASAPAPAPTPGPSPSPVASPSPRQFAYVTNTPGVSVIDTTSNSVTVQNISGINTGFIHGVSFSPDGSRAYVANNFGSSVDVIDTSNHTLVKSISIGQHPRAIGVTMDGTQAYVVTDEGTILVVTTATNTVTSAVPVPAGRFFFSIAMSPDGIHAYVADLHGSIVVLNTQTNSVITSIPVAPQWVAVTPDAKYVYAVGGSSIWVVDSATNTIIKTITAGNSLRTVAITPNGKNAYVTDESGGGVFVLDTVTNAISTTIPLGNTRGLAISGDGTRAFVTLPHDARVSVIDTSTNSVVSSIPVGGSPVQIGIPTTVNPAPPSTVPLTVTRISGNEGGDSGPVSVTILGRGFAEGASAKLVRSGELDIVGEGTTVTSPGTLNTNFNLTGRSQGVWDLVVVNHDGVSATLAKAFTIEAVQDSLIQVEILGRTQIRPGRQQTYYISYANRGNTNVYGVPIFVDGIPADASVNLGFEFAQMPQLPGQSSVDWTSVPTVITTDTSKIVPLLIPVIPPGQTGTLRINITLPSTFEGALLLRAWATNPLYTATIQQQATLKSRIVSGSEMTITDACIYAIAKLIAKEALKDIVEQAIPEACIRNAVETLAAVLAQVLNQQASANPKPISFSQFETGILKTILACLGDIYKDTPLGIIINWTKNLNKYLSAFLDGFKLGADCHTRPSPPPTVLPVTPVSSFDPNDKVGSNGVGTAHYLSGSEPLNYAIFFENKSAASAPAQDVVITDQLDGTKVDLSSFTLGPIAFGSRLITLPSGLNEYAANVDLRPGNNLVVKIEARLDKNTGVATWKFTSLDPVTLQPTTDPLAGFLPPNRVSPEGEGNVSFNVKSSNVISGTEIRNKARIVFDTNAPIDTPEWTNTIDTSRPQSRIQSMANSQSSVLFNVNWGGSDLGSGVGSYSVFVSENGGPFSKWLDRTSVTSAMYVGRPGTTYAFYTQSEDRAGNKEIDKTAAEAATTTTNAIQNVIDDTQFIVRQNYLDFLNREPDTSGFDFWTREILSCGLDQQCVQAKRINVSAAFFLSIEFQGTGYLVERIYKTAYGDAGGTSTFGGSHQLPVPVIRLNEFLPDTQKIGQGVVVLQPGWEQQLENNKNAFAAEFVQRQRFTTAFPSTMTAAQFVDTLNTNAGNPLSSAERNQLVNDLTSSTKTRAQVLRAVAENRNLNNAEFNRAFVLMQYFGYLRRDPNSGQDSDYTGYDFWLTKLNQFNGNYINAEMVKAFMSSVEYRRRFGL